MFVAHLKLGISLASILPLFMNKQELAQSLTILWVLWEGMHFSWRKKLSLPDELVPFELAHSDAHVLPSGEDVASMK